MHRATHRATLAGVGTTGSLVAAVVAVAAVTTSVITFTAWPDAPARDASPVLEMQHRPLTTRALAGGGAIALPTGAGTALGIGSAATTGAANGAGPNAEGTPLGGQAVGRAESLAQPQRSAVEGGGSGGGSPIGDVNASPLKSVVDATSATSQDVGTGVKVGGAAAGDATSTLSPLIGTAVGTITGVTGDSVAKAGSTLADILDKLGGGK
jgi:hypothetical protein